jgi:hypothetical protein
MRRDGPNRIQSSMPTLRPKSVTVLPWGFQIQKDSSMVLTAFRQLIDITMRFGAPQGT